MHASGRSGRKKPTGQMAWPEKEEKKYSKKKKVREKENKKSRRAGLKGPGQGLRGHREPSR